MRWLMCLFLFAAVPSEAAPKRKAPKILTIRIEGAVVPFSAADGPRVPPPKLVVVESKAEDPRDSLNAAKEDEARAFSLEPAALWRCAARYEDAGGVRHFVKGDRAASLPEAAEFALSDCRIYAGKAHAARCRIAEFGCRRGMPRPPKAAKVLPSN